MFMKMIQKANSAPFRGISNILMTLKEFKYLFVMSLMQPNRISPDRSAFILLTIKRPNSSLANNSRGLRRKYYTVLPVTSKGCNAVPGNQVLPSPSQD